MLPSATGLSGLGTYHWLSHKSQVKESFVIPVTSLNATMTLLQYLLLQNVQYPVVVVVVVVVIYCILLF